MWEAGSDDDDHLRRRRSGQSEALAVAPKYLACGEQHALLVAENGSRVFATGANKHGQLGTGFQGGSAEFELAVGLAGAASTSASASLASSLSVSLSAAAAAAAAAASGGTEIRAVAAGARHSAALTADGQLFTWGANDNAQLGHTDLYGYYADDEANDSRVARSERDTVAAARSKWRDPLVPCRVRWFHEQSILVTFVACGAEYTLAVDSDNSLYSWGQGDYGNLGHGDTLPRQVPTRVRALEGRVITCAAGSKHALAICYKSRTYKYRVRGRDAQAGAGGALVDFHGQLETRGGHVYSWGHGDNGRLGHGVGFGAGAGSGGASAALLAGPDSGGSGYSQGCLTPTKIRSLESDVAVSVAAGEAHSAVILSTGALMTWGSGSYGRLGLGGDLDVAQPTQVTLGDLSDDTLVVRDVSLGVFHTMIISVERGGTLYACGDHEYGKLGLGRLSSFVASPTRVGGALEGAQVYEVCCGAFQTLAWVRQVDSKNDVFGWGAIREGTEHALVPVPLGDFSLGMKFTMAVGGNMSGGGIASSAALGGGYDADAASGANGLRSSRAWESTDSRSLKSIRQWFLENDGLDRVDVVGVSVGSQHSVILSSVGLVYSFGSDEFGQLGHGNHIDAATRAADGLALEGSSNAGRAWNNFSDQRHSLNASSSNESEGLGQGEDELGHRGPTNTAGADTPSVGLAGNSQMFPMTWAPRLPKVVKGHLVNEIVCQVVCGGEFCLALTTTNQVYAWGRGQEHQLGLGYVTECQSEPQLVAALSALEVTQVEAGEDHAAAILSNGHLFTWGSNEYGKLGIGQADSMPSALVGSLPKRVRGALSDKYVRSISLGMSHSACITGSDPGGSDNMLFTWGGGWRGRLGLGNHANHSEPVRVGGVLRGCSVDQVSCGAYHTLSVADGDLYGWGQDTGCLGHGSKSSNPDACEMFPRCNESLKAQGIRVARAVAGTAHSLVVATDGTVWSCGHADYGRLGHDPSDTVDVMDGVAYSFKQVQRFRAGAYTQNLHRTLVESLHLTGGTGVKNGSVHTRELAALQPEDAACLEALRAPIHSHALNSTTHNHRSGPGVAESLPAARDLPIVVGRLNHSAALFPDGRLFFWGCNGSLRCGVDCTSSSNGFKEGGNDESGIPSADDVIALGTIPMALLNSILCDAGFDSAAAARNNDMDDSDTALVTAADGGGSGGFSASARRNADPTDLVSANNGWSSDDYDEDNDGYDDDAGIGDRTNALREGSRGDGAVTEADYRRQHRKIGGQGIQRSVLQLLAQVQAQDDDIESALLNSLYDVEERERACQAGIASTQAMKRQIIALDTRLKILTRVALQQTLTPKYFRPPHVAARSSLDIAAPGNREKLERIVSLLRGHPCFFVQLYKHHFCTHVPAAGDGAANFEDGLASSAASFPIDTFGGHSQVDHPGLGDASSSASGVFRAQTSLRTGSADASAPAGGRPLNNAEDFVDLVAAVFGDFASARNEHLFLTCLTGMMKEALELDEPRHLDHFHQLLFSRDAVLTKLVDLYFTSPRVVSEGLHLQLSKSLMKFLNAVNDNDQGPLTLEPNPLAVFEDLRHEAFSSDEVEYAAQTHSAYNITQVQEEVQSRVSALKSHVLEWLEILQHIIRGITSEVQFLLSFIGATLRDLCRAWNRQRGASGPGTGLNHDSSSTSGARGNDARAGQSTIGAGGSLGSGRYSQASVMREVGHILVQFLLKNLLFFPKYFGLLASDYTITGRHSSNLKRLVQVVDRVVGGRLYDTSAQPWMQPLNSIIVAQSNQIASAIQSVLLQGSATSVQQKLQKQLAFDFYDTQLQAETEVLRVRKNVLLYLRCLLAHSKMCLTPMAGSGQDGYALLSAVQRLVQPCGRIENTAYHRLPARADPRINLRVDNDLAGNQNDLLGKTQDDLRDGLRGGGIAAEPDEHGQESQLANWNGAGHGSQRTSHPGDSTVMHVCTRCGATLPEGLRPAQSSSRQTGAATFVNLPAALNDDEKNFCWVLHNMRALDASAMNKTFQELLTEAMDSLHIEDVLKQSSNTSVLDQGSNNRDFDSSLQRYVKYHQALAKVLELERSSTNNSGLKQMLRRINAVYNEQKQTQILLQEGMVRLRGLRLKIQEVNANLHSKFRALALYRNVLQNRVQAGGSHFGVANVDTEVQDARAASGSTDLSTSVLKDGSGESSTLASTPARKSMEHAGMPITKLTRVLLQRLEKDEESSSELALDGIGNETGGVAVRGVHMTFSLPWLLSRGIVRSVRLAAELPKRVQSDMQRRLVYVVTSDRRRQSSYIFNAVYDGSVVVDTFYVSVAHLHQLRRTVADFADSASVFGGSKKIVHTIFCIKPLLTLCTDHLENQAVVVT